MHKPHLGLREKYHKYVDPLLVRLFQLISVSKDKIVFCNFNGRGFGDNPKYVALEILRRNLPYKLYWVVSNNKVYVPDGFIRIKYRSIHYIYTLSTMKVYVDNQKIGSIWKKKKGQYYIQTWHGSLPIKKTESAVADKLSQTYVCESKRDSEWIDTFIVPSKADEENLSTNYWYKHELWKIGNPRSDIFFNITSVQLSIIKNKLKLSNDTKILLYAPTFRDDRSIKGYNINFDKVIDSLQHKTGKKWVVLVRLHPNATALGNLFEYNDRIINVCNYSDPNDLSVVADAMISDYSSIISDMFLQKKPVFLYACDYKEYIEKNRPLNDIYWKLPCKCNYTQEELISDIDSFDKDNYLAKLKHFMEVDFVSYDNGHASEKVVDKIEKVIKTDYQSPYYSK